MGTSLAALLIMAVFFTGVILMYRTTLAGNVAVSSAIREASNDAVDRTRTNLRVTGLNTNECRIVIDIQNNGSIAISNPQDMDVIATMDTFQGVLEARRFQYDVTAAANSWSLAIDEDIYPFEPSVLNPGESGILTISWPLTAVTPPPALGYGEARAVTIGTANGSTADYAPARGMLMTPCVP